MAADHGPVIEPILRALAEVVLTRPGAGGLPADPEKVVRDHTPFLIRAMIRSPGTRAHAAELLASSRPGRRTKETALLLLHPDDSVVQAAVGCLGLGGDGPRDRAARRTARTIKDLKQKLATAQGRLDYAWQDVRETGRALTETQAAMAELAERAEAAAGQLAIAQRRFQEPRPVASALLGIMERSPVASEEDAEARDPRNSPAPSAQYNDHLLASARAADVSPQELLRILRAVVDPPAPRVTVTAELDLRVTPLGGGTEIGGSCVLVEAGGTSLLIDAGLRPGTDSAPPRDIGRALAGPLHGVVVTHAHNDHCGYVPALAALRPDLRILATRETVRLMPVMWGDNAKLMRLRARQGARWGDDPGVLYGAAEVEAAAQRCEEVAFGVVRRFGEMTVELFPAGHILGAAGVVIRAGERRVVVTGDISGFRQESVDGYALPDTAREADLLVLETTCCGEEHDAREVRVRDLVRSVAEVCQGGGRVLIPAFALGRAQEIALLMRRHLPEVPVRLDGMAVELSRLFETMTERDAQPLRIFDAPITSANRPAELEAFRTGVVITTSGMLNGGPAVQWASRILPEAGSALFISGYQDEESPGTALRRLAERGGEFTLMDRDREVTVPVRARVGTMRLSAHADRRGLLDIADEVAARRVMLVHGVRSRQRRFGETLRVRNQKVVDTCLWRAS